MKKLLDRPDLKHAARFFALASRASRQHSRIAGDALRRYGDHGPQISGVVRDHFPDSIKARLRRAAAAVSAYSDLAYAHRPPRVHMSTMRKLARAVAERDGSGFYGPQPPCTVAIGAHTETEDCKQFTGEGNENDGTVPGRAFFPL